MPLYDEKFLDEKIEKVMNNMISVIQFGRKLTEKEKEEIFLKKPIAKLIVINYN